MDPLDRLAGPAADLLGRVDDLLAEAGAPDGHRIWPLLRRLRVLPAEAVTAVAALRPEPMTAAAAALRDLTRGYAHAGAALAGELDWAGAGAEAYTAHRDALATHLTGLTGRLEDDASFLDALADWMTAGRRALARTLAEVLGSAEAVAVVVGPIGGSPVTPAAAAAEIGVRVLATVADLYERGEALRQRCAPQTAELAFRPATGAGARLDGTLRIGR